jgi:hypothetical protein
MNDKEIETVLFHYPSLELFYYIYNEKPLLYKPGVKYERKNDEGEFVPVRN